MKSYQHLHLLIILVLMMFINRATSQQLQIPLLEEQSIRYLLEQYYSDLPLDQNGFCNNQSIPSQKVTCELVDQEYHVTSLPLRIVDPSINLLFLMSNMTSLQTLVLQDEKTVTIFPPILSMAFPNLTEISFFDLPINISWPFCSACPKLRRISLHSQTSTILINSSWRMPLVEDLSLSFRLNDPIVGVEFQQSSFPSLNLLQFTFKQTTQTELSMLVNSSSLTNFYLDSSLTVLPTLYPLPPNLSILYISNNDQLYQFPWSILTNRTINIYFKNNTNLVDKTIPDTTCSNKFIELYNVTAIPDCFWCYSNDTSIIKTSLTIPSEFTCPMTIDSRELYLIRGSGLLQGSNIGWGLVSTPQYKLVAIVPNQKLQFSITTPRIGPAENIDITFNSKTPAYTFPFTFIESGITIDRLDAHRIQPLQFGLNITFKWFNPFLNHTVWIGNTIECIPVTNTSNYLYCLANNVGGGNQTVTIRNINNNQSTSLLFPPSYPVVTSVSTLDPNEIKNLSLFGYYGENNQTGVSVYINNTIECIVTSKSRQLINCSLINVPSDGIASISVIVDALLFNRTDAINFKSNSNGPPGGNQKDQCIQDTKNCYGNGQCEDYGICVCNQGYDSSDNCRTQFVLIKPNINNTKPIASFDMDGIDFDFEMISIQELDLEEVVLKEIPTVDWTSTIIENTTTLTSVYYQLNTTSSSLIDSPPLVSANISFSTNARSIMFGPQELTINPNSIKLAVNISSWAFKSNLSYLRVVFKTKINNKQSYTFDCEEHSIDSLSFDQFGATIQYLRIIKEGVQFNGRFIDYSLADGRPTYSKTQLVSMTPSETDDDTSIVLIGITLAQCQSCILDPDFTPLLSASSSGGDCNPEQKWKIIVGVVVGVIGGAAVAFVLVVSAKRARLFYIRTRPSSIRMKPTN
ncbi:hypothetical protein DFA_06560 [Cavenderia fasciculata]|uniref:EGF-like domain-containing protein n=1 Tax=Cavenderia fasciculata TaxID=261658 RepID=F4PJC4_CACFS|nr:uncharacterized protein DFA_06560 [Cavenderia fasciculata]EGG24410.1 hypothetical protein DFA_06560 [Cavenderia fasciculata]|eukprot:XP_004362261.1 hypothetical protein DFA_06560 [Cavenderia fasciculata]